MGKTVRYNGGGRKREQAELDREEQALRLLEQEENRTRRKDRKGNKALRNKVKEFNNG